MLQFQKLSMKFGSIYRSDIFIDAFLPKYPLELLNPKLDRQEVKKIEPLNIDYT